MKRGLLFIQLGTPDAPTAAACRPYLREFLSDPRVIDIGSFFRFLLVNALIVPFRSPNSARAYQKIWTPNGSPLRVFSEALIEEIKRQSSQQEGTEKTEIALAMRYGSPSLEATLKAMLQKDISHLDVIPLYPQYASASTGSSIEEVFRILAGEWSIPSLRILPPFFQEDFFLDSLTRSAKRLENWQNSDHFLFSFHGIPERQILRGDRSEYCLKKPRFECCDKIVAQNVFCYRAHCSQTAFGLMKKLGIPKEKATISFQSRLGRTPWLKPYTDEVLKSFPKERGIKKLMVFCPSFVADCLETLEEIDIRGRKDFYEAGGKELYFVRAPNADPEFARGLLDACMNFTR